MAQRTSSPSADHALRDLGRNIRIARIKRRISVRNFADRIGVSERTVIRLDKGSPGTAIGTLAMACLALGELDRISGFLDMGDDDVGLMEEVRNLPRSVRTKSFSSPSDSAAGTDFGGKRFGDVVGY